jgi:RNA polymerase sigma-70 factor (ECF subfamily)
MEETLTLQDETVIIASILSGETQLFHDLIRPYEHRVYRMALSFMKDEFEAEDVAQEAFLKAFRNLAKFRGQARFSTWLISITLNEARGRLRHKAVMPMQSLDETSAEIAHVSPAILRDWREVPSETLERKEIREMLQTAIGNLAPIYREVVLLRDVEELTTEDAAAVLKITTASVKVRLHRARLMLQKQLAPQLKSANPNSKRRWVQWS